MNAGLDWSLIGPGLLAGLLVLLTHVPLGLKVLARGIIFIDLAVAQVAALGAGIAHFWLPDSSMPVLAGLSALLAALGFGYLERRAVPNLEALIGVVYVLAACAGVIIMAHDPHGAEMWRDMAAGQILWVTPTQLGNLALLTLGIGALLWFLRRRGPLLGFYLPFALAITASVSLVGVFLVFASLIMPALAVTVVGRHKLLLAWLVGALGMLLGMLLSVWLDWPAGPAMVLLLAATAALFMLLIRLLARQPVPPAD